MAFVFPVVVAAMKAEACASARLQLPRPVRFGDLGAAMKAEACASARSDVPPAAARVGVLRRNEGGGVRLRSGFY